MDTEHEIAMPSHGPAEWHSLAGPDESGFRITLFFEKIKNLVCIVIKLFPGRNPQQSTVQAEVLEYFLDSRPELEIPPSIHPGSQILSALRIARKFALIAPGMFSAYGTFMLRRFFMGIPRDLEEAAAFDGCGPFAIYWKVILPLSGPAPATLGIFCFLQSPQK